MRIYRVTIGLIGAVFLSGCLAIGPTGPRDAPTSITVTDANVAITGPAGFCIDTQASRIKADRAFVLLASCAGISNQALMPQPDLPVALIASIAPGSAPTHATLEAYFRSSAGMAHLGKHGPIETVRFVNEPGVFYVQTSAADQTNWRGFIPLRNGMIASISLRQLDATPIPDAARHRMLQSFASQILRANSGPVLVLPPNV